MHPLCTNEANGGHIGVITNTVTDDDDDDDKLYLTTLTLSAEAGFHNGRVKKTLTEFYK